MSLAITRLISTVANPIKFAEAVQKKVGQKTFWLKKKSGSNLDQQILDPNKFWIQKDFWYEQTF